MFDNFEEIGKLPVKVIHSQLALTGKRLYLIGGVNSNSTFSSRVYSCSVEEDGTLGKWITSANFPVTLSGSSVLVSGNKIHVIGGYINGRVGYEIYSCDFDEQGFIGDWKISGRLPIVLSSSSLLTIGSKVYLVGGYSGKEGYSNSVLCADINTDGGLGEWKFLEPLPSRMGFGYATHLDDKLLYLGGFGDGFSDKVYGVDIRENGDIGNWQCLRKLPIGVAFAQGLTTNDSVSLFGGSTETGHTDDIVTLTSPNNKPIIGTLGFKHYAGNICHICDKTYILGGKVNGEFSDNIWCSR